MDKEIAEKFINEYVELCKKYGCHLWSGEPWYGLDLLDSKPIEEHKGNDIEKIIRDNIMIYDD